MGAKISTAFAHHSGSMRVRFEPERLQFANHVRKPLQYLGLAIVKKISADKGKARESVSHQRIHAPVAQRRRQ